MQVKPGVDIFIAVIALVSLVLLLAILSRDSTFLLGVEVH